MKYFARLTAEATPAKPKNGAKGGHSDMVGGKEGVMMHVMDDALEILAPATIGHNASATCRYVCPSWRVFVWRWDATSILCLCQLVP